MSPPLGLPVPAKGSDETLQPREFASRTKELGSGSLGKMRLHKSGKVTLKLGEVSFEVCVGTDCACAQELVALSADKCCSLGDVHARMLCIPSVESLIIGTGGGLPQRGDFKFNPGGAAHSLGGQAHVQPQGQGAGPSGARR